MGEPRKTKTKTEARGRDSALPLSRTGDPITLAEFHKSLRQHISNERSSHQVLERRYNARKTVSLHTGDRSWADGDGSAPAYVSRLRSSPPFPTAGCTSPSASGPAARQSRSLSSRAREHLGTHVNIHVLRVRATPARP
jgi:hypothetical protein